MVFAFQLNFPQSPVDQMFPECELGPSKRCLLALCFFPLQTDICLPFDAEQKFSPSMAGAEVNWNIPSGQYFVSGHLKFLWVNHLNLFWISMPTCKPPYNWSENDPTSPLAIFLARILPLQYLLTSCIILMLHKNPGIQRRGHHSTSDRIRCSGVRDCDATQYPFSSPFLVIESYFYLGQWCLQLYTTFPSLPCN